MSDYQERLQHFLDVDCGGDWGNCKKCPGDHFKDGVCCHPDHPSMQIIESNLRRIAKLDPAIKKIFHEISNTYQALLFFFEHQVGDEDDIKACIQRDIKSIHEIKRIYR